MIEFSKKKYIKEIFKRVPHLSTKENMLRMEKIVEKCYKENTVNLYNSYTCKDISINANDFLNTLADEKYIAIESGVFFKDVKDRKQLPPSIEVEWWFACERDRLKTLMKYYDNPKGGNDPVKARYYNYAQDDCKRKMNTFYGLLQMIMAHYFNPDLGASITCRGRSVVTVCALSVESVFSNFFNRSLDALLYFIQRTCEETFYEDVVSNLDYAIDDVINNMRIRNPDIEKVIRDVLDTKTKSQINRMAIKNSIYRFLQIKEVGDVVKEITGLVNENNAAFVNPYINEKHKNAYLKPAVDKMAMLIKLLFGFYWFQEDTSDNGKKLVNTQDVIKNIKRRSVVLIDTDSNMIALGNVNKMIFDLYGDTLKKDFTKRDNTFTVSNIATVIIDETIKYSLEIYKECVNIPVQERPLVAFKNEYYYNSFALTSRKKNYIGLCDIKEGVVYDKSKLDVKGLMFIKSSVNEIIGKKVEDILEMDILRAESIDLPHIIRRIRGAVEDVRSSLRTKDGSDFYLGEKLNSPLMGTLPSQSRCKSVEMYNVLELNDKLVPPTRFLTINIDYDNESIQEKYPEHYGRIKIYERVHGIHKLLARLTDFDIEDFREKHMNDIQDVMEVIIGIIMEECKNGYSKLMAEDPSISIFYNGYMKNIDSALSRDDIALKFINEYEDDYVEINKRLASYEQQIIFMCNTVNNEIHTTISGNNEIYKKTTEEQKLYLRKKFGKFIKTKIEVEPFKKISFPEGLVEALPQFILDIINVVPDTMLIENLCAPIIESVKLNVIRNSDLKSNITNILNYY